MLQVSPLKPAVQDQRLCDKESPHSDHRVHPPTSSILERIPEIEPTEHVEARKPHQHCRDSRLPSEPPLDDIPKPNQ